MGPTVADLAARTVSALDGLVAVAEAVEDELSYIRDLQLIWTARLRAVGLAATEAARPTPPGGAAAIERLADEAGRITDPHRAIDWLSTLPQAAILALGDAP